MKRSLPWVALGLLVGSLIWTAVRREAPSSRLVGTAMPVLRVRDLRGSPRVLDQWTGRVRVVNVWASWCGPCVQEMPSLQRLHQTLGPEGLVVLGLTVDDTAAEAEGLIRSSGVTFPQAHDPDGATVYPTLDIDGLPTTFIVGKDGRILDVLAGLAEYDTPEAIDHFREILRR